MSTTIWQGNNLRLMLTTTPNQAVRKFIHEQIKAFNNNISEHHREIRQTGLETLDIIIRNESDEILGGLTADIYWGWLDINDLWVHESLRGQGFGRRLLTTAEAEGVKRGCRRVFLTTFSFQAKDFYERLGYRVVGRLDDYPPGHAYFWMRKDFEKTGD